MAHVRRIAIAGCLAMMTSGSAFAQMDFSGEWTVVRAMDNTENPYVGDWFGLPLNEAGLARAEAWDASIQSVPEWQCRPHGWAYIYRGPTALRITKEVDPVSREITAFHAEWQQSSSAPIYLDGRPHPPEHAPHAWNGFSTATWVGDMLKIKTTHLKEDYIRRNGVQISDESTVTTWWIRRGDILTWINVVHDPVYLSEPLIRSGEYRLNPNQLMPTHPCTAADEGRPKGEIPHHLPGKNPFLTEPTSRLGIPDETIWVGAQTMYPEFRAKLRKPGTLTPGAAPPALQNDNPSQNEIHVLPVRGNVYMLVGAGANITASVGKDGVLLVDTGAAQMTDKVLAAVNELARRVTSSAAPAKPCAGAACVGLTAPSYLATIASPAPPKPISYIINTHLHPDHTGGNQKVAEAGRVFGGGPGFAGIFARENAMIIAHENVLLGMSAATKSKGEGPSLFAPSSGGLPTETFYGKEFRMNFFNGEGVVVYHQPAAHTDGDSLVFFRGSDVISAGDIFSMTTYPIIDLERGGSIQGILDGLNRVLELAVPEYQTEGGTMIIPGHGRLADSADVAYYRDMATIIRDRVQAAINEGKTVEQVKAARLSKDYDTRFGRNPAWTGPMFVEAVYRSLTSAR